MTPARLTWQTAAAGRWTARIMGTLMVLFVLSFVLGEGIPSFREMTPQAGLYALCLCLLFGGLIVAWFWEGWGGLLSLLGWGWMSVHAGKPAWDLPLSIPAAIGGLHLLCWWRLRGPLPEAAAPGVALRMIGRGILALVVVFVLLSVNEIFGEPPLMSGFGGPPPEIAGTWDGAGVVFTIAANGAVTGTIGNAALSEGEFVHNRSWFGRMMHWRTDYLIRGTASGERFTVPLMVRGGELDGALFLSHAGVAKPVGLRLQKRPTSLLSPR